MRAHLSVLTAIFLLAACPGPGAPDPAAPAPASPEAPSVTDPAAPDQPVAPSDDKEPVPRFARQPIGASGMELYLPEGDPAFEHNQSEDGSDMYTGELTVGRFHFACVGVKFKAPLGGTPDDREATLTAYMDFLQSNLGITAAAGYGRGHTLDATPDARGVIDFWEGSDGSQWAVKGWITDTHLAVLMLYGPGEYPYYNAQAMFLDGIRFP